jgi:hypothetical protein
MKTRRPVPSISPRAKLDDLSVQQSVQQPSSPADLQELAKKQSTFDPVFFPAAIVLVRAELLLY